MDQEKNVKEYFEKDAKDYLDAYRKGIGNRGMPFQQREKAIREIFNWRGARVLDVGGGPGIFTGWLLDRDCDVFTLDIAREMMHLGEMTVHDHPQRGRSHFVVGSAESLPFLDNSFDAVLCVGLVEYVNDLDKSLRELARVIPKGGGLIITGPNKTSLISMFDRAVVAVVNTLFGGYLVRKQGRKFFEFPFAHRLFEPPALQRDLEKLGFRLVQTRYTNFRSGTMRGPLKGISERLAVRLEKRLAGTGLEKLGTNFIFKLDKL
jgi:ubiquinone/menaquinone biosynthesis C-methylase UbiE